MNRLLEEKKSHQVREGLSEIQKAYPQKAI